MFRCRHITEFRVYFHFHEIHTKFLVENFWPTGILLCKFSMFFLCSICASHVRKYFVKESWSEVDWLEKSWQRTCQANEIILDMTLSYMSSERRGVELVYVFYWLYDYSLLCRDITLCQFA